MAGWKSQRQISVLHFVLGVTQCVFLYLWIKRSCVRGLCYPGQGHVSRAQLSYAQEQGPLLMVPQKGRRARSQLSCYLRTGKLMGHLD